MRRFAISRVKNPVVIGLSNKIVDFLNSCNVTHLDNICQFLRVTLDAIF